ncbi:MAG: hypothetical protein HRT58_21550, partial [Crocinitomicaceae bacterium]|nr:hypothetical protein [Crocinitomicaceae bacterium]
MNNLLKLTLSIFLIFTAYVTIAMPGGPGGGCTPAATIAPGVSPVSCADPTFDAGTGGSIDCATATPVAMPGCNSCISGTTANSQDGTTTTYGACGAVDGIVWFQYTVPDANNTISLTPGTLVDPILIISDQPCGAGTFSSCESGAGGGAISDSYGLTPGSTAWIGVGSTSETDGTFDLCIESIPAPATGGNTCGSALNICDPTGFNVPMNNSTGSGTTPGCFFSAPQQDTWITFTVLADGTMDWSGIPDANAEFDWAMYDITSGCPGTEVSCNYNFAGQCGDDFGVGGAGAEFNTSFTGTAGQTYAIQIDNFSGNGVGFAFDFTGTAIIAPIADFTMNNVLSCTGSLTVDFTDASLGAPVEYDFGNGNTYTGTNPPNQTYSTGVYPISVDATAGACVDVLTQYITVYDPLAAILTPTPSPCATPCGGSVALSNVTGGDGVYTYLWSDGSTGTSISNVCPGAYSVTIMNATCGTSLVLNTVVTVIDNLPPTATNPADINVSCVVGLPAFDITVVDDEADNITVNPIVTWISDVSDNQSCPETIIRTYRITDDCGLFIDVTQTIIITVTTGPVVPVNGASTVNCPADANVQPAPPAVNDQCGDPITPTVVAPTAVACEGDMVWTFTYTDCAGNTADWLYTYTVDLPTFAIATPLGASTVNCPADANVQPTDAGVITDLCGNVITPTVVAPTAVACEGDMVWTFTYTDCAGNAVDWTHTYTVDLPTFAIATPLGTSTVNCPTDANVQPTDAGVVTDLCGNVIIPTVVAPTAVACEGDMVWTFTYTDCAGNAVDWTHTYTVDMPIFAITTPSGASTVNCPADGNVQP